MLFELLAFKGDQKSRWVQQSCKPARWRCLSSRHRYSVGQNEILDIAVAEALNRLTSSASSKCDR